MAVEEDETKSIELLTVQSALLKSEENGLSEEKFREAHGYVVQQTRGVGTVLRESIACEKTCLFNHLPILKWLPRYNFKENIFFDLMAGVTVSVLQIPHGLAFAPLAYQEPVVGLYMAIFPILMYVILGTSRHLSLGMMGILIMMVGAVVGTHANFDTANISGNWSAMGTTAPPTTTVGYSPLQVAITVTFTVGMWQLLLGLLQLGSLCILLSNSLVSGLTTAASIHIIVIQLKNMFGLSYSLATGPLKLFFIIVENVKHIQDTNYVSLLTSISFFLVLMVFNEWIKPLVAKKTRIPIPMEFILIVVSIVVSELVGLEENYGVATVGTVPSGLPHIVVPPLSLIPHIAFDSLIIALVSISFNISLGKVFAKKGGYELYDNQELVAYGFSNILGGFFQCLPVSASLSRSMVQFAVGGKTELAHAISMLSVLLMLLFLGPFFAKVPLCVLAAIVLATLKGLLVQIADLPGIWRASKLDGTVWILTFLSVVLVDLDYGIGIGLIASIVTLLIRNCANKVTVVTQSLHPSRLLSSQRYPLTVTQDRILVLKIVGHLNFFNSSKVSDKLLREITSFIENLEDEDERCIIIDLSSVPSIDPTAAAELLAVFDNLRKRNCRMVLSSCQPAVYDSCDKCSLFDKLPKSSVMASISAAVEYFTSKKVL